MLCAGVFLRLLVGVVTVTGADKRTAFDDTEADAEAEVFPVEEFLRRRPARNREMFRRGLQILADGQDVGFVGRDIADRLLDLVLLFADAQHDPGFGDETAALRMAGDGAGAVVTGLHADRLLQPFDGLEVVVINVGLRVEDDVDVFPITLEIGDEDFDGGVGAANPSRIRSP